MSGENAHGNERFYMSSHQHADSSDVHEKNLHVCINLAGLISSIWAWGLMHLLRLLATMSSAAAGWARPIISLAVAENTVKPSQ